MSWLVRRSSSVDITAALPRSWMIQTTVLVFSKANRVILGELIKRALVGSGGRRPASASRTELVE